MAKAYMAMGLTKSMSSNHKAAMDVCVKALPLVESLVAEEHLPEETASSSSRQRHYKTLFKYWLRRAMLQKRASSFRHSQDTLLDLE